MDEEKLRSLKNILDTSTCPVGCRCHKVKSDEICKARTMGVQTLLECLEDKPQDCLFSFPFGGSYFCKCSTRIELAKLLGE